MAQLCLHPRPARPALLLAFLVCALPPVVSGTDAPQSRTASAVGGLAATPGKSEGVIRAIEFAGLRRIAASTLRLHIGSREGQPLDAAMIESDVRALDRLGWFDSVTAVVEEIPLVLADARPDVQPGAAPALVPPLRLIFQLEERPFLAGVEFRGSRSLSTERARALLAERGIVLKEAMPVNRTELWRAARALEAALAEIGHPQATVQIRYEDVPTAAVRAILQIGDGPRITVGRVSFSGNHTIPDARLRRQMKSVTPQAHLAGLRGKDVYTPTRMASDLNRIAAYYHNQGFPEARVGRPDIEVSEVRARRWLPWPRRVTAVRYHLFIPIEEGRLFRWGQIRVRSVLPGSETADLRPVERALRKRLTSAKPYSEEALVQAREALEKFAARQQIGKVRVPEVDTQPEFNRETSRVEVTFRVRPAKLYTLHRIEFLGAKRFSDRYYRRRILAKEGEPFDAKKLELGIARLNRSGFIRPLRKEDVRVGFDEARLTADLTIRMEEIGRQKISLVGGHAAYGSTLGLVYNVFDLFGAEELITSHFEGGPESLQVMLGIAKESVFGTRGSVGLSVFRNVVRPRMAGPSGPEHLFTASSTGFGAAWNHPLSAQDTLGMSYQLSANTTDYSLAVSPALAGLNLSSLRASTSSRSLGLTETHVTDRTRIESAASVSGGRLGGSENLLRASLEYARFQADPLSRQRNTWAFRSYMAGVSNYRGVMPLSSRYFPGSELVRGFRSGELGPYAIGTSVQPAGANLVGAVNAEYRVPLGPRTELASFFDAGSGRLMPGWLGPLRPAVLEGTNGALRASTGLELRLRLPVVEQTLRVHYALNPLRLAQSLALPDGSRFRPPERRGAFGWALGNLF